MRSFSRLTPLTVITDIGTPEDEKDRKKAKNEFISRRIVNVVSYRE